MIIRHDGMGSLSAPPLLVACGLLLAACANIGGKTPVALPPQVETAPIIVVGEIHGTNEAPEAVASLVERLSRDRPVALALELPDASLPWVERFVESDGGAAARDAVS